MDAVATTQAAASVIQLGVSALDNADEFISQQRIPVGTQFIFANPNYLLGKICSRIRQVVSNMARPDLVEADVIFIALTDIAALKLMNKQHRIQNHLDVYRDLPKSPLVTATQSESVMKTLVAEHLPFFFSKILFLICCVTVSIFCHPLGDGTFPWKREPESTPSSQHTALAQCWVWKATQRHQLP